MISDTQESIINVMMGRMWLARLDIEGYPNGMHSYDEIVSLAKEWNANPNPKNTDGEYCYRTLEELRAQAVYALQGIYDFGWGLVKNAPHAKLPTPWLPVLWLADAGINKPTPAPPTSSTPPQQSPEPPAPPSASGPSDPAKLP